jgi:uncharacterized repeat protein (TIGR01451 family)
MKSILSALLFCTSLVLLPIQVAAQDTQTAPPTTTEAPEAQALTESQSQDEADEAKSPVEAVLEAFLVQTTANEDGTFQEELVSASTASPGDILQYNTIYTNVSDIDLIGLTANGQIPMGTSYLESSAIITSDAIFEVLIEAEKWQELPAYKTIVTAEGNEERVEASAEDYTQIRWLISNALEPEQTVRATYRVQVNN